MKETHGEKADAVDSASVRVGPPIVIEPAPFPGMLGIGTPVEQVTATVPWNYAYLWLPRPTRPP